MCDLATAAVQSQASPVAIAGAVQRVTDTTAERSLKSIANELATIQTELNSLPTLTQPSPVNGIQVPIVLALLPEIWMNTLPQGPFSCPV